MSTYSVEWGLASWVLALELVAFLGLSAWLLFGQDLRRWWCRRYGCRWVLDDRGAPVTSFRCCTRCGRWER